MIRLRALAVLGLALVLGLTSVTMAVARGQATATGQVVICTGQGTVTVQVDAEGNPTGPAHLCPDCALSLFADAPAAPERSAPAEWRAEPFRGLAAVLPPTLAGRQPSARGPPPSI